MPWKKEILILLWRRIAAVPQVPLYLQVQRGYAPVASLAKQPCTLTISMEKSLLRARMITFLVEKGLLPPERAQMLRGWVHSGFNVHRSRRVLSNEREDMERLAQYRCSKTSCSKNLWACLSHLSPEPGR